MRTIRVGSLLRLALLNGLLAACQSYQPVTLPVASHLPQDPHVEVRVTEKNGERSRLVATRVEHDSLVGRNFVTGEQRQAVAMDDIINLEIGEPDTGKTVLLVVGGTVVLAVTFLGLLLLALSHYSGN